MVLEEKNIVAHPLPSAGVNGLLVHQLLAPPGLPDPLVDHDLPQDYRVPGTLWDSQVGEGVVFCSKILAPSLLSIARWRPEVG